MFNRFFLSKPKNIFASNAIKMALEFNIFGTIGGKDGQNKDTLQTALTNAGGQEIILNVSSSGGDVFEGLAMQALIKNYSGSTISRGIGIVASAATIVLLAAKKVQMSKNSFFMLHNSWGYVTGNAAEMQNTIELLKKVDEDMLSIYVEKVKKNNKLVNGSEDETYTEIKRMMDAETWLTSEEALNFGLIDMITEEKENENKIYENTFAQVRAEANFKNIPKQILSNMQAEKKSFLKLLASWLGLNAEITEEVKSELGEAVEAIEATQEVTENVEEHAKESEPIEAVTEAPEVSAKAAELSDLEQKLEEKRMQLEAMEAEIQAKISYKTETSETVKPVNGFTNEQISQASRFINSLINKN